MEPLVTGPTQALPVSYSKARALPAFDTLTSSSLAHHLPEYIGHLRLPGEISMGPSTPSTWSLPSPASTMEGSLTPAYPGPPPLPAFEWRAWEGTHDDDIEPLPENLGYLRFPGEIPRISTTWSLPSPALTPENYAIPLQPELPALAVSESRAQHDSCDYHIPLIGEIVERQNSMLAGQTMPSRTSGSSILWNVEPMPTSTYTMHQPIWVVKKRGASAGVASTNDPIFSQASYPEGPSISTTSTTPLHSTIGTQDANYHWWHALPTPPITIADSGSPGPSPFASQTPLTVLSEELVHPKGGVSSGWTPITSFQVGRTIPTSFDMLYNSWVNDTDTTRSAGAGGVPACLDGSNLTSGRSHDPKPDNDEGTTRSEFPPVLTARISSVQAKLRPSANARHNATTSGSLKSAPRQRTQTFEQTSINEDNRPNATVCKKRKRVIENETHSTPLKKGKRRSDSFVQKPLRRWEVWSSSTPGIRFKHSL